MSEQARRLPAVTGVAPQVAPYAAALEQLRTSLIAGVEKLSSETLARRAYAGANTIGTLLVHIAEAELFWMQEVVRGEGLTPKQRQEFRFNVFGKPGAAQAEPREWGYFAERLAESRAISKLALADLSDAELSASRVWKDPADEREHEFNVRWILNHLVEHEAHHRGQVFLLKAAVGR